MADMTYEEYLAYLNKIEREASGGGGIVCRAKFSPGYKAFVPGYAGDQQSKTWFPYDIGEPGSKEQAMSRCKVFITESGSDTRPQLSYGFQLYLASVKARKVGWKGDRYLAYPLWQPATKEIVAPAVKDLMIFPGDFWARWAWADDPSGYMETNQNSGEEEVRQVAYPAERYKDEAAAEAAAAGLAAEFDEAASSPPSGPPVWLVEEARRLVKMADEGAPASVLAAQLQVETDVAQTFVEGDKMVRVGIIASALEQSVDLVTAALG